jgi:glyoxylase-like metal-dependent hydrolase (beta-lactamase superfamily II)
MEGLMIKIDTIVVGPIHTNCYIVWNQNTKEALVFDPGDNGQKIHEFLREKELALKAVLFTHGHFDHISAAPFLINQTHAKTYISRLEESLVSDANLNCSAMFGQPIDLTPDEFVRDNEVLSFLDTKIKVISTPGHTKGSVCYYFEPEGFLISGDTLFFESYGRTDFPTGNDREMKESLTQLLTQLKDEVIVYPGHGCETNIGYEKINNPWSLSIFE